MHGVSLCPSNRAFFPAKGNVLLKHCWWGAMITLSLRKRYWDEPKTLYLYVRCLSLNSPPFPYWKAVHHPLLLIRVGRACLSMDFNRVLRDILASWRCHCSFWAHVWAGGHCVKTSMQQQSSQMTSRLAWLMMALLRPRRRIHIQPKLSSSKAVMTHDLWQTDTVIPFPTYLLLD